MFSVHLLIPHDAVDCGYCSCVGVKGQRTYHGNFMYICVKL